MANDNQMCITVLILDDQLQVIGNGYPVALSVEKDQPAQFAVRRSLVADFPSRFQNVEPSDITLYTTTTPVLGPEEPLPDEAPTHGYFTCSQVRTYEQFISDLEKEEPKAEKLDRLLKLVMFHQTSAHAFGDIPNSFLHAILIHRRSTPNPRLDHIRALANEPESSPSHYLDHVLIGRPAGRFGLPSAVYDEHLALLSTSFKKVYDRSDEADTYFTDAADRFVQPSKKYLTRAIGKFTRVEDRTEASLDFFQVVLGDVCGKSSRAARSQALTVENITCHTVLEKEWGDRLRIPRTVIGVTRYEGEGDPLVQCIKAYAEAVYSLRDEDFFSSTCFPTIFICVSGHHVAIYSAVVLNYIAVDELLRISLVNDIYTPMRIIWMARIASALSRCSSSLDAAYRRLAGEKHVMVPDPLLPIFPHPAPFSPSEADSKILHNLVYQGFMNYEGEVIRRYSYSRFTSNMHSLFVGTLLREDEGPTLDVVVKFTVSYCKEAHDLLAPKGLAPKLYCCCRIHGDLFMVVMERVGGRRLRNCGKKALKPSVLEDLRQIVSELRGKDLVHGDIRDVNVLIDPSGEHAQLVDFDWAGRDGKDRYPSTTNKDALGDEWHPEVDGYVVLKKEHDVYAVENVLKRRYFS